MTSRVQEILHVFDLLSDGDRQEVLAEILRRELAGEVLPLSDSDLVGAAEETFLQLDSGEKSNAP